MVLQWLRRWTGRGRPSEWSDQGRRRKRSPPGPVCRTTVDLRRVPGIDDPDAAATLLRGAPGVLQVHVDARRRRAVVLHDSRTSFPALFNWLQTRSRPAPVRQADVRHLR